MEISYVRKKVQEANMCALAQRTNDPQTTTRLGLHLTTEDGIKGYQSAAKIGRRVVGNCCQDCDGVQRR